MASVQTAATAQTVLEGIPLPVRKEIVLEWAERQSAPADVMQALRAIPDRQYQTLDEIGEAIHPVQPSWARSDVERPGVESDAVPGGEAYLDPSAQPGSIREPPTILEYEQQLVREPAEEPGEGVPEAGEEHDRT